MTLKASMSLDLDNKWSYLKTHGSSAWERYPSYLPKVVPRILEFLDKHHLNITFFIVAKDATVEENRQPIKALADAGHEIASHSFSHDPWLHRYSREELRKELASAEEVIQSVTGQKVDGFRGPGYSLSGDTLEVLKERGYRYDATVFPNSLNPLARAYLFSKSQLSAEEKAVRKDLFGRFQDAFSPVKPFIWQLEGGDLPELPVTTMPIFKIPFHFSYILYAAKYSKWLAMAYFKFALTLCRLTRTEPSLLLHPLDFLGGNDGEDELAFFPAMSIPVEDKIEILDECVYALKRHFELVTVGEHIDSIAWDKVGTSSKLMERATS
jgi:peptidoglycan/xylan/chitin deacetylase (PgdA/CDA1 family)